MVFLDESNASTTMSRLRGRAERGVRALGYVPHGHYKTQTMLAGIRLSGPVAPLVLDGAVDGEVFTAWTEQFLLPELKAGDVVIADNLSSHKALGARKAIEAAGCQFLFLPPYSPDFNPIEEMWSKIKECLRDIGAREFEALFSAIGDAFSQISPSDCQGYFRHCGHVHTLW